MTLSPNRSELATKAKEYSTYSKAQADYERKLSEALMSQITLTAQITIGALGLSSVISAYSSYMLLEQKRDIESFLSNIYFTTASIVCIASFTLIYQISQRSFHLNRASSFQDKSTFSKLVFQTSDGFGSD